MISASPQAAPVKKRFVIDNTLRFLTVAARIMCHRRETLHYERRRFSQAISGRPVKARRTVPGRGTTAEERKPVTLT